MVEIENRGLKIVIIPDPQITPETSFEHLDAAGNYIVRHKPDVIVAIGDWCDMPSLNRFASNIEIEGQRVKDDIQAGKDGMLALLDPLILHNDRCKANKKKLYKPRMVFTVGNHCPQVRVKRFISEHPILDGFLEDDFEEFLVDLGWEVYDFLEIVDIEGIRFSHYFINPHSAKKAPLSGAIDTMIKNCGFSFVQGHTQGLKMGKHYLADGTKRLGVVAGSFYQHDESYMGVQGNKSHWRGIVQLNDVKDGCGDVCELSLPYLMRKYG